jgi:hypothetical protein
MAAVPGRAGALLDAPLDAPRRTSRGVLLVRPAKSRFFEEIGT